MILKLVRRSFSFAKCILGSAKCCDREHLSHYVLFTLRTTSVSFSSSVSQNLLRLSVEALWKRYEHSFGHDLLYLETLQLTEMSILGFILYTLFGAVGTPRIAACLEGLSLTVSVRNIDVKRLAATVHRSCSVNGKMESRCHSYSSRYLTWEIEKLIKCLPKMLSN